MNNKKYERIREMILDYQDAFERQQPEHHFLQVHCKTVAAADAVFNECETAIMDQMETASILGFIEGIQFAMDTMNLSGNEKNAELLQSLIDCISENDEEE